MRQFFIILSIMILFCAEAHADWEETFHKNYTEHGIQSAVTMALGEGHSPDKIIKIALPIKNLEKEKLIKALFCGLAPPGSIYEAAEANGIDDATVSEGYEIALAECAREMEENLNVEVGPNNQSLSPSPSKRTIDSSYESEPLTKNPSNEKVQPERTFIKPSPTRERLPQASPWTP